MSIQIGEAIISALIEIDDLRMPLTALTGEADASLVQAAARALHPDFIDPESGDCRVSQHALLVEVGGKRFLIDPCVGDRRHRPAIPMFHMIDSPMLTRMEALGVTPDSIDYVLCTHFHLDHVGWNTRLEDGRWVPTFPNARYQFSRTEDAFWRQQLTGDIPGEEVHVGVYAECIAPVLAAGLADLIAPGARIGGCLTVLDAAGHTPGHIAALLDTGDEGLLIAGDIVHHPVANSMPQFAPG